MKHTLLLLSFFVCFASLGFAQIPENPRFAPGSYAFGPYRTPFMLYAQEPPVAEDDENTDGNDTSQMTEWERFAPVTNTAAGAAPFYSDPNVPVHLTRQDPVPYLAFHYDKHTQRFHLIPYEPGYAACPQEFPAGTSPMYQWVSSMSSHSIPQQPMRYLSYYDPDPVVLPATIELKGQRFYSRFNKPMPLPVGRPDNAVPVKQPRTRMGLRFQETFGDFTVPR